MKSMLIAFALLFGSFVYAGDVDWTVTTAPERPPAPDPFAPSNKEMHSHDSMQEPGVADFLDYATGRRKALREGKPLMVWVKYKCPSSANQILDVVHARADTLFGDSTQRVVVAVPSGDDLVVLGEVSAPDCCATNLFAVLDKPLAHASHSSSGSMSMSQGGAWSSGGMMMQGGGHSSSMMQPMRSMQKATAPRRGANGGACAT